MTLSIPFWPITSSLGSRFCLSIRFLFSMPRVRVWFRGFLFCLGADRGNERHCQIHFLLASILDLFCESAKMKSKIGRRVCKYQGLVFLPLSYLKPSPIVHASWSKTSNQPYFYVVFQSNHEDYSSQHLVLYLLESYHSNESSVFTPYLIFYLYFSIVETGFNQVIFIICIHRPQEQDALSLSSLFFANSCILLTISLFWVPRLRSLFWWNPKDSDLCVQLYRKRDTWRGNIFCYFQIVVHVKTTTCDVEVVYFDSFFLWGIESISYYTSLIEMGSGWLVLCYIPWDISMGIVAVDSPWG